MSERQRPNCTVTCLSSRMTLIKFVFSSLLVSGRMSCNKWLSPCSIELNGRRNWKRDEGGEKKEKKCKKEKGKVWTW